MNRNSLFPRTAFLFSFVLILLVACDKSQPVQPVIRKGPPTDFSRQHRLDLPDELNTSVLAPLTVGNWWKYERSIFDISGTLYRKDSSMIAVLGDTVVTYEGQSFLAAVSGAYYEKQGTFHDTRWLYMNDSEGLNVVGGVSKFDTVATKYVERKYPVNVGNSWVIRELQLAPFGWVFSKPMVVTCLATNEPFETPAGTIRCHVYHFLRPLQHSLRGREHTLYYRPGIGLIGWEERSEGRDNILYRGVLYSARIR